MTHFVTANGLTNCTPAEKWYESANADNSKGAESWKVLIILIALTLALVATLIRPRDAAQVSPQHYEHEAAWSETSGAHSTNPQQGIDDAVSNTSVETRLARVTFYWSKEGDYYTSRRMSATGVRLQDGHGAVDPKVIPYGSVVKIPGMGEFVAVDTGSAIVSRRAAREAGRNPDEKNALVVDVYCSNASKARVLGASAQEFAVISWSR
jgi:3D (Asp-Asp-Asp) domain-containing protein